MFGLFRRKSNGNGNGNGATAVAVADTGVYKNKGIACVGCGCWFIWEAGEQLFYADKGLAPPRRCPTCRQVRRLLAGGQR